MYTQSYSSKVEIIRIFLNDPISTVCKYSSDNFEMKNVAHKFKKLSIAIYQTIPRIFKRLNLAFSF